MFITDALVVETYGSTKNFFPNNSSVCFSLKPHLKENNKRNDLINLFLSLVTFFSFFSGVDKGTRKPKALSPPETLKLYIFTADPQRKEHFLKALDEFVDSKFVEQEIEDFDQISPDMVMILNSSS